MNPGSRPTRRREFLAASVGAVVGSTGCLEDQQSGPLPSGPPDTAECPSELHSLEEETTADSGHFEMAVGDCPTPGTSSPDDLLFWQDSGKQSEEMDPNIVCSPTLSDDAAIRMVPATDEFEPPGIFSIALHNRSRRTVRITPQRWRIYKRDGNQWFPITKHGYFHTVENIGQHQAWRWCIRIDDSSYHNELVKTKHSSEGIEMPALGSGEYAFGQRGSIVEEYEEVVPRVIFFARFSISGEPISLTPSGHLRYVNVGETEVRARWTVWEHKDDMGIYSVEKVDDPDEYERLITEQIVRNNEEPLRDALVLFEEHDVDVVRMVGKSNGSPPFRDVERTLKYDGEFYRISAEDV